MSATAPQDRAFEQRDDYRNYEANLRFLTEAGLRPGAGRLLEIGSGKGRMLLRIVNPDAFPQALRTNLYVKARLRQGSGAAARLRQGSGAAR